MSERDDCTGPGVTLDSEEHGASLVDISQDADLGRAVRIRWIDSGMHHDAGWAKREDFFGGDLSCSDLRVLECESVGLWMGESETAVALGQTRDTENGNWMAAQVIWKPSILSREWLDGQ